MTIPGFAELFKSPHLDPNCRDDRGRSLLERYATTPEILLPLLSNPGLDVNANNGGPLRAARRASEAAGCTTPNVRSECLVFRDYISNLERLGAY